MSIRYGQFCPVAKAAEILGERWTILIIRELLLGTSRYSDFQRTLSKISPTLLTKRLGQLVDCGLAIRRSAPGQPRPTYHPTPACQELESVIDGLSEWGKKWTHGQMRDDELDVQLLMFEFCRRMDVSSLPSTRAVIGFRFQGLSKFARWWIVIEENRERELCVGSLGKDADLDIVSDVRTMVQIWAGDIDVQRARKDGRLRVTGDPHMARSLSKWLRPGATALIKPSPNALSGGRKESGLAC